MHHYFNAITNPSGDSLVGHFGRVINRTNNNTVPLASDDNGTPVSAVSGVENMAKTDDYGNLSFYVEPGSYDLEIYAPNATSLLFRVPNVAMSSSKGERGDPGPQGDPGPPGDVSTAQLNAALDNKSMLIPTFSVASTRIVPTAINSVQTGGHSVQGIGPALYIYDNTVDAAYVSNNPRSSFRSANGRGFRLSADVVTPEMFGARGDGGTDDTSALQAALKFRGSIQLINVYYVSDTLICYDKFRLYGNGKGVIRWRGASGKSVLQDSSLVNIALVNRDIVLENFEIEGIDNPVGDIEQLGVHFYRTANVIIRGLKVHGLGGSGIRFGNSQSDTYNVLVEMCNVYNCASGDGIQGTGDNVTIRGNTVADFGDSGIAFLRDFNPTTNPNGARCSTNLQVYGNTIRGSRNLDGSYNGPTPHAQTGIAIGPFEVNHDAALRIFDNDITGCYQNAWIVTMRNVDFENNRCAPHSALDTGNIRFDGVAALRIRRNKISDVLTSNSPDLCGIQVNAQRSVFGASVFDGDVTDFEIANNDIQVPSVSDGIRFNFEQVNGPIQNSPAYTSKLKRGTVHDNRVKGTATPIYFAPQTGGTAGACDDVTVSRNSVDGAASAVATFAGLGVVYTNTRVLDNTAPSTVAPVAGDGLADVVVQHKVMVKATADSGVVTTLFSAPAAGFYHLLVHAWVQTGTTAFSALTEIVANNGSLDFGPRRDGANLTFSLSGRNIQASQTAGGTTDIRASVTFNS